VARSEDTSIGKPAKTTAELEATPKGVVRRWLAELELADKAESDWRKEGKTCVDVYCAKEGEGSSFPILYSNTETLQPSVYNSTPRPDVRRRFRDQDPIGKMASRVLERALSYQIDDYDFDTEMVDVVQDVLLPGRGLARIKFEPHFVQETPEGVKPGVPAGSFVPPPAASVSGAPVAAQNPALPSPEGGAAIAAGAPDSSGATPDQSYERLAGQSAQCEHVQWDRFRHGPGKRWREVQWVSFEHDFTYEMAVEKFGEAIANMMKFSDVENADAISGESSAEKKETKSVFAICTVHEIWDKAQRRVLFVSPSLRTQVCGEYPDPLRLKGFFPIPRPVYAVRTTDSLVPKPLYRFYKKQAAQLELVSVRIDKITRALKLRGMYAKHINEASAILDADDNTMIATSNAQAIAEAGGIDKLIWIMPLDKLAAALEYLYKSRDQIKQAIYEISGLADVIRGATNPNETLGAQELKSQWGSVRMRKIINEVQRFIRDLMRLKAEVISEHFTQEQLAMMTNVQLPDEKAKATAQAAVQAAQQQPPQPGQPPAAPPKEALDVINSPTWEDVMGLLKSDQMRQYRVDIETDSTVADTIDQDMKGLSELVGQIGQIIASTKDGVPMDAAKAITLSVVRRSRMGSAVEDAVESLEQPPAPAEPPPPPDHSLEIAQIKAQSAEAIAEGNARADQAIAAQKEQAATDRAQIVEHMKQQTVAHKAQADHMTASMEKTAEHMTASMQAQLDAAVKIICAGMSAQKAADDQAMKNADREVSEDVN
jgi:hypothetical protein